MPFIKEETINKILSFEKNKGILRPSFKKKAGHPVVFSNKFFDQLLLLKEQEGANSIIKNNLESLCLLELEDQGVLEDIDYLKDTLK